MLVFEVCPQSVVVVSLVLGEVSRSSLSDVRFVWLHAGIFKFSFVFVLVLNVTFSPSFVIVHLGSLHS